MRLTKLYLKEDTIQDHITTVLTTFKTALSSLDALVTDSFKTELAKQLKLLQELKRKLNEVPDTNDKITLLTRFKSQLRKTLNLSLPGWATKYSYLNTAITNNNVSAISDLENALNKLNSIEPVSDKVTAENLKSCRTKLQGLINKVTQIKSRTIQDQDKNFILYWANKSEQLIALVKKVRIALDTDDVKNGRNYSKQLLDLLGAEEQAASKESNSASVQPTNSYRDWRGELIEAARAGDRDKATAIWKEYYSTVWGEKEQILEPIKPVFDKELLALGFSESTNVFITAVKILLSKNVTFTYNAYATVHNAYIYSKIKSEDLKGNGILGTDNLLLQPVLYTKSSNDVNTYIECWRIAENSVKNKKLSGAISELDKYRDNLNYFLQDLFFEPGDIFSMRRAAGNLNGKLKPANQIQELLAKAINTTIDNLTDIKLPVDLDAITKNIRTEAEILNACTYLILKYTTTKAEALQLFTKYKLNPNRAVSPENLITFSELFNKYNITRPDLRNLLIKLTGKL